MRTTTKVVLRSLDQSDRFDGRRRWQVEVEGVSLGLIDHTPRAATGGSQSIPGSLGGGRWEACDFADKRGREPEWVDFRSRAAALRWLLGRRGVSTANARLVLA